MGVCAPSGRVDPRRLRAGLEYLRRNGHPVLVAPHARAAHGYLAGPDARRAEDINSLIDSRRVRAILFARGGFGLTRLLDRIDLDRLRRRPKVLLGFSDVTALFMSLQSSGPYQVHYGPVISELADPVCFDEGTLWRCLRGPAGEVTVRLQAADVLRPGRATAPLLGGCLTLLCSLLGTRHDPDYRGSILFWEDVGEEPYRIDRMLTQMRNAGKLEGLRGMVVGSLARCEAAPGRPSLSIERIIAEVTEGVDYPIVRNVRAGHVARKLTLPLGNRATLDTARRVLSVRLD